MNVDYPNPSERERLALTFEELGESVQAIGKIERHGFESDWTGVSNRTSLERELGHVLAAMALLFDAGDVRASDVLLHAVEKLQQVQQYLHQQINVSAAQNAGRILSKVRLPGWS